MSDELDLEDLFMQVVDCQIENGVESCDQCDYYVCDLLRKLEEMNDD